MVGMYGIGGAPDPANLAQPAGKVQRPQTRTPVRQDEVQFSQEALEVATAAARAAGESMADAVRLEQIKQAQERLEAGAHKIQSFVRVVAARLNEFL